jgi:hypothetical protein
MAGAKGWERPGEAMGLRCRKGKNPRELTKEFHGFEVLPTLFTY